MSNIGGLARTRTRSAARTALQITAVLSALELLFQGATAGQIISRREGIVPVHGGGAIAFHVLSALMLISAAAVWRAERGAVWPTVVSALVFILGLVEAYLGDSGILTVHVPIAILLALGTACVLAWSFVAGRSARRHTA
jgi:hypothetical protein